MGLFSSRKTTTTTAPAPTTTTTTRHSTSSRHSTGGGLFSRNKHPVQPTPAPTPKSGGFFSGMRTSNKDPATHAATRGVVKAEQAERDADRALVEARMRVADAQAGVTQLRADAEAEARAAKLRQKDADKLGKRSSVLGRHNRRFF